jgi:hypothetical protein
LEERRRNKMAMEIVLELQELEVPETDSLFGSSCTSSTSGCCNGKELEG